jgi:hypothetical protein
MGNVDYSSETLALFVFDSIIVVSLVAFHLLYWHTKD